MMCQHHSPFDVTVGFGVQQSDEEAIMWWTKAAEAGSSPASVRSMNTLAMYYSLPDSYNLDKVILPSQNSLCVAKDVFYAMVVFVSDVYLAFEGC